MTSKDAQTDMSQQDTEARTAECLSCPAGKMREDTTSMTFHKSSMPIGLKASRHDYDNSPVVVVLGVPAEVCDMCGEAMVSSETTEKVLELVKNIQYLWNRFPSRLPEEGIVIGGRSGEEGGVVRADYQMASASIEQVRVGWEG